MCNSLRTLKNLTSDARVIMMVPHVTGELKMTPFKFADYLDAERAEAAAAATGDRVASQDANARLEEMTLHAESRVPADLAEASELLALANHFARHSYSPGVVRALRVVATGGAGVELLIELRTAIADAKGDGDFPRECVLRNVLASIARLRSVCGGL
jgi:hypothetical protein